MNANDVIKEYEGFQIKRPITIKRGYNLKHLRRPCFPKTSSSRLIRGKKLPHTAEELIEFMGGEAFITRFALFYEVSLERARKDLFYWARSISHDLNDWLYRRNEFAFNNDYIVTKKKRKIHLKPIENCWKSILKITRSVTIF